MLVDDQVIMGKKARPKQLDEKIFLPGSQEDNG